MNIAGSIWSEKAWMAIAVPTWSKKQGTKAKKVTLAEDI